MGSGKHSFAVRRLHQGGLTASAALAALPASGATRFRRSATAAGPYSPQWTRPRHPAIVPRQADGRDMTKPPEPQNTATIMIMLASPAVIDTAGLVATLQSRHPQHAADGFFSGANKPGQRSSAVGIFAGSTLAIMSVDASLPDGWQPVAARSIHWPAAAAVCARHRAHIIVALMGAPPNPLAGARTLSAVAGALMSMLPGNAFGALWNTTVLNSAETWISQSRRAFAAYPNLPIDLWRSMHPFKDQATAAPALVTIGLAHFVGRELELINPAHDMDTLLQRAHGLATYLIQHGPVIQDGHTFGVSATERITAQHRLSQRLPGIPVIAGSITPVAREARVH